MGTDESIEQGDLGPGLHVFEEDYPLKRAGHLAARLGADLCATLPQVNAAIQAREGLPAVDAEALEELRSLAMRLDRAHAIVAATHARAVDDVAERLAPTGAGLAVHPSAIRDRAAAVESARAALVAAEEAVASHEATRAEREEQAERAADDVEVAPPADPPEAEPVESPGSSASASSRRTRSIGVIVIAAGAGLVVYALEIAPLWAALIPLLLACLWALRYLQPPEVDADIAVTTSLLREVATATDDAFGARRASTPDDATGALLAARRDQAEEQVRVAERHWHDLAGADADVAEVDAVVRRFDPQHEEAMAVAAGTVSVRAASTLVARLTERWQHAWESRGGRAPEPLEAEAAVSRLEALAVRPVVLVGPAVDRAEDLVMASPGAPVIVLDGPID